MTSIKITRLQREDVARFSHPEPLLRYLGGPTEIVIPGLDRQRTRVVVTLLHANETSGLQAIMRFLRQGQVPATDTVFIIASVNAALTEPLFFHRMLPEQKDLNRCFTHPPAGVQGALAQSIKTCIAQHQPECIVDMHNTSGDGPAFCVSTKDTQQHVNLASVFSQRVIITDISLGSLMEQEFGCPCITFEAGGSNNDSADNLAYDGLLSLLRSEKIDAPLRDMEVLRHPRRLELLPEVSVSYAEHAQDSADITFRSDIEKFNFGITPAGTLLGWTSRPLSELVKLDVDTASANEYFSDHNQSIVSAVPMRLFMVTTRADIARSDCLFYFQC